MRRRPALVGVLIAALAAVLQMAQESAPLNDDFSHLALSRQLLGGDLPVRDFVESGITLTYGLSAAAQSLFGHRLLAEAIVIGLAFLISTYAVFALVRTLTGSTVAAASAAIMLPLAGPRGYSYPKIISYAVAAMLWWLYVRKPSRPAAIGLGVWTALAFSWRPDHGVYVAIGVVLAMVAAHGFRRSTLTRGALSATTALVLLLPFFTFVQRTQGLRSYAVDGFSQAETHHTVMDSHPWPRWPIHRLADIVQFAPAETFAPAVSLRWAEGTTPEARTAVLARHHLAVVAEEDQRTTRVRLTDTDPRAIVALINEAAVSDTAGLDRSSASVPMSEWPPWQRVRFRNGWLRLRLFAGLDEQRDAGEAAVTLFYLLPVVAVLVIAPLRRYLAVPVTPAAILAFCAFVAVVDAGVIRTPYSLRAADGVVMPAILLGLLVGVGLTMATNGGRLRRIVLDSAVVALILFAMTAMATAGQFGERVGYLAGDWRSMARLRGAWSDTASRLVASPPLRYWEGAHGTVSIRFAQYANACVPPSDRIAVLWFAPEIYYYSDRLMAIRHLVFAPGLVSPVEQRRTSEKFNRTSPPVVFAESGVWTYTRTVFPELVADVERDYVQAGSLDDDEGYLLLVRRGRAATGIWGPRAWPCFR